MTITEVLIDNRVRFMICTLRDILTNRFENLLYKFLRLFQQIQLLKCKDKTKINKKRLKDYKNNFNNLNKV
jgi:hypothetical protein